MQESKAWDELIRALIEISEPLLERTSAVPIVHVPIRIIDAMFLKSVDTLRAVRLLYRSGFPVQAQALIRILFELRVDIELFYAGLRGRPCGGCTQSPRRDDA